MYIKKTERYIDSGEPHLGKLIDLEDIVEVKEVVDLVIEHLRENDELPTEVYGVDVYTGETMTICVGDYL